MQLDSFLKFGSLAFDVANDEKVRSLMGMVHSGARRRGFIGPWQQVAAPSGTGKQPDHWPESKQPIPFAPGQAKANPAPAAAAKPAEKAPAPPEFDLKKWVNMDNAKKVMGWAGTLNQYLNK